MIKIKAPLVSKGRLWGSFHDIFYEPVEDRSDLCTGGTALGQEPAVRALDQALGHRPAKRRLRIGRNTCSVREAGEARARRDVIALILCIAVQNRSHLLSGDIRIRAERQVTGAVDDVVVCGPCYSIFIVAVPGHIHEAAAAVHGGLRAAERRLPAGAIKRGKGIAILRFG